MFQRFDNDAEEANLRRKAVFRTQGQHNTRHHCHRERERERSFASNKEETHNHSPPTQTLNFNKRECIISRGNLFGRDRRKLCQAKKRRELK